MYTPTPAQQAAHEARKAAFKEITKKVAAMNESERAALAARTLAHKPDGHQFSPTNQLLIAMQYSSATICAGFHDWKKQGRKVRKGEHGIAIWIPLAKGGKKDENGLNVDETEVHFTMAYIFDIGQTEPL